MDWAIEYKDVVKRYGNFLASDHLTFQVKRGDFHGIVGENGAGKTTAMKLLYGLEPLSAGEIRLFGKPHAPDSPLEARAAGIGMVHQHFRMAESHSALEHLFLTHDRSFFVNRKKMRAKALEWSETFGLGVRDWDCPVDQLVVSDRQKLEILKYLALGSEVLILDEPTAVLTPGEVEDLFKRLRLFLKKEGKTLLLITHKLKEIFEFTDSVTVFRQGKMNLSSRTADVTEKDLIRAMVGREVSAPPARKVLDEKKSPVLLDVKDLCWQELSNINLQIHEGEILGLAGVSGNGQERLVEAIIDPNGAFHQGKSAGRATGSVKYSGKSIDECTPREMRDGGLALVPEDRHREGVVLEEDLIENYALGLSLRPEYSAGVMLDRRKLKVDFDHASEEFDVRPRNSALPIRSLSGGNQQKVILARELQARPKLLLACQPTRGVDIGAIERIHSRLIRERDQGMGVLLVSSELEEVMTLSDRIAVFCSGKITAVFSREEFSSEKIGLAMAGKVFS
jgi:simple sugar transport system ATP-binding protein